MNVRGADWKPSLDDPEVRGYIIEEAGEDGLELARYLRDHTHVSCVEVLDAYKDRKASAVRKALYRLMEAHAAEYEKDTDSKGWETFYWDLDLEEIKHILRRRWADELLHIQKQLVFEKDHQFYGCADSHRRILFEDAMDIQFKCPVCHRAMEPMDGAEVRKALMARAKELEPHVSAA